jgi:thiamine biosynthesis protein ThiS
MPHALGKRESKMEIIVNGEKKELDTATLYKLVEHYGLLERPIVIELNGTVIQREAWEQTELHAGSRIEIVQFVGGG